MDSSEESSGTEDISDQPGPSLNITQMSLEENINAQIELRMGTVRGRKCFLIPKIMAVLDQCHIIGLEDKAQILCSDTTSSNTGHINGAITFLEQYADREMTYFPCRHHIYELVLRSVFEYELNEVTSSPDVAFFKKIREKWNNLEKENYLDRYKCLNPICSESEILNNVNCLSNALKHF
ncbi:hypothetical protein AVEN_30063-1 [Araneus ventricosus]|uniref:Uncharacterized protein n=1 Tax=Araneus ventricosus TaxID=182803 RepID=A0A4Y2I620_ARAVE|nr:hypothetical protein AVEN_30063-1 [Araneus ventricosus]